MSRILVTGANGFVGNRLRRMLTEGHYYVRAAFRRNHHNDLISKEHVVVGDIGPDTRWKEALKDIKCVIHLAARVHVMDEMVTDPLSEFRKVNVEGTLNLVRQAAAAGVQRFIFISSIKVNGEETPLGKPFTADDPAAPVDPYGISKNEAEQGLENLAEQIGIEVVIIRPPLIYGPGVKANFLTMVSLLYKGIPLPLGAIHNKRSLIALDNLVNLIMTCIEHPASANHTFLAGDGEDLSTTELLHRIAKALGRPARLVPVPEKLLELGAKLLGKEATIKRLSGSLQVDISKTQNILGWVPPMSVDEGLKKTADWFKCENIPT